MQVETVVGEAVRTPAAKAGAVLASLCLLAALGSQEAIARSRGKGAEESGSGVTRASQPGYQRRSSSDEDERRPARKGKKGLAKPPAASAPVASRARASTPPARTPERRSSSAPSASRNSRAARPTGEREARRGETRNGRDTRSSRETFSSRETRGGRETRSGREARVAGETRDRRETARSRQAPLDRDARIVGEARDRRETPNSRQARIEREAPVEPPPVTTDYSSARLEAIEHGTPEFKRISHRMSFPGNTPDTARSSGKSNGRVNISNRRIEVEIDPDRVVEIQRALAARGMYEGEPTGVYDEATYTAMRDFQMRERIDVTGYPTAHALKRLGLSK